MTNQKNAQTIDRLRIIERAADQLHNDTGKLRLALAGEVQLEAFDHRDALDLQHGIGS